MAMTENVERATAEIIPFPVKPRGGKADARWAGQRAGDRPQVAVVDCGAGWYHEAAIRDAELAHRR